MKKCFSLSTIYFLRSTNSGYSLLELLIVMMIMIILFSFGYANYRSFERKKALEGFSTRIKGELRLAQEYALAGNKPAGCTTLLFYSFNRLNNNNYRIDANCSSGVSTIKGPTNLAELGGTGITFSEMMTYTNCTISSAIVTNINFKPVGQGTDLVQGNCVRLLFTQTSTGSTVTVTVYSSGRIE